MSTGYECYFLEVAYGEWYYILQDWDCPVGAWDWREHATAYGSFPNEAVAKKHLGDHHANPGGYSTHEYQEGYKPDEVEAKLIAEATR